MNRHKLAYRLRVRANRVDRMAWKLEKLALARGNDPDLQNLVADQRRLAELLRVDAQAVKPIARRRS